MLTRSFARTNKLYCTHCKRSIKKGDEVVFDVDMETRTMNHCYCIKCSVGEDLKAEVEHYEALRYAFGIGQD